jgi:thiol-disulfide isomerase/thioredoxin
LQDAETPFFTLQDSAQNPVSIADFKGKWVLIDVWASWCKPCIADIPQMKALQEKFRNENIVFLGVNIDEEGMRDIWLNVLRKKSPAGIQVFAGRKNKLFMEKFIIDSVPRYILIAPDGKTLIPDLPKPYSLESEAVLSKLLRSE